MRDKIGTGLARALANIRFAEPLESEFLAHFDAQGRASRLQVWVLIVLSVAALLVFNRTLLQVPAEVIPLGRQLVLGVMIPLVLRWLSTAWSPLHRWSAALYIAAVLIEIVALMLLRIACLQHGFDTVPVIIPVALLLSLIVVQIRFLVLAPTIVLGLIGVVGAELWAFEADSNRMFQLAAAVALVLVALSPAYELERWARIGWLRERNLDQMARTDGLTGLANRRQFDSALRQAIRLAARERKSVALMVLDVDHFKSYNDHYGHPAGDECLRAVADWLGRSMRRPMDFAARTGGEEFAAVWFDAGPEDARRLAESLRAGVAALAIAPAPGRGVAVTASAGLIHVPAPRPEQAVDDIAVEMMRQADAALYRAKHAGRDCLMSADDPARFEAIAARPGVDARSGAATGDTSPVHARGLRPWLSQARAAIRFDEPLERAFRASFEQQGRASRTQILVGLLGVVAFILMFDRTLLKIPEEARLLGQLTLILGLVPAATLGLIGSLWHRAHRWSATLYIVAIWVIVAAQMLERVLQLPQGYDVVPLMMPVAVLLSLSVVQIRFFLLAPALLALTLAVISVELIVFEADSTRLLEVAAALVMVMVTLVFSYKVERSARSGWLRERRLEEMARTDALTGLANRRHFDATLRQHIRIAAREGKPLALVILDIDHFKSYNDHYGHPAGDRCLAAVGRRLAAAMRRPHDFAARLGGEEFAAVWLGASAEEAPRLAESLRRSIAELAIAPAPGRGTVVTASAGFVQIAPPASNLDAEEVAVGMMRKADLALYHGKHGGRDRFVVSDAAVGGDQA